MLCNKSDQGGKTYTVKTITHCLKEMKEYTSKWRDIHVHRLENLILFRCPYNSKQSTD